MLEKQFSGLSCCLGGGGVDQMIISRESSFIVLLRFMDMSSHECI